jgi:hypothetical protein
MKFRKKPVVVDAELYDGTAASVKRVMEMGGTGEINNSPEGLYIVAPGWTVRADKGDWIVKGAEGDLYPCKPDIFEATYEDA